MIQQFLLWLLLSSRLWEGKFEEGWKEEKEEEAQKYKRGQERGWALRMYLLIFAQQPQQSAPGRWLAVRHRCFKMRVRGMLSSILHPNHVWFLRRASNQLPPPYITPQCIALRHFTHFHMSEQLYRTTPHHTTTPHHNRTPHHIEIIWVQSTSCEDSLGKIR